MSAVRVTVCSGARRVDLCVPGAVPVAELVPDLARHLGSLDLGGTLHLTTSDGTAVDAARGLAEQSVSDGHLLHLATEVVPAPRTYDDLAEAMADVVAGRPPPPRRRGRPGRAVGVTLVAGGVAWLAVIALPDGVVATALRADVGRGVAGLLAVLVLAGAASPMLALAAARVRVPWPDEEPTAVDVEELAAAAAVAHRILLGLTIAVGLLPGLAAPLVTRLGDAGVLLGLVCAVLVLLRGRRFHSRPVADAATVAGLASTTSVVVSAVVLHDGWRLPVAVALLVSGAAVLGPSVRTTRVADLAETACVVAVPPLLLVASGLLDRLPG